MTVVLNDLYDYGLKIYQDTDNFKFSLDSILLAEFVDIKASDNKIVDFCSGTAPLPLILSLKTKAQIYGIEIQEKIYALANKSIRYNNLDNQIQMLNINVSEITNYDFSNQIDIVTCNPPFFKVDKTSLINISKEKAIARHELTINLNDIFASAKSILKDKGVFYLVHRPERLQEILNIGLNNNLYAKEIKFITSKPNDYAIIVLFKFVKNAHIGTKVSTITVNRNTKTYQNIFKTK